jgi:membrane-bound metal-dependent hydrolase YbcI (DUF457 family)
MPIIIELLALLVSAALAFWVLRRQPNGTQMKVGGLLLGLTSILIDAAVLWFAQRRWKWKTNRKP